MQTRYSFRPKLIPSLVTIVVLPIMLFLGHWQSDKARQKQALQDTYDARASQPEVLVTSRLVDAEDYRYRRVMARGQFDTARQILLDNRVYNGEAGYHVITPLKIANSEVYVLVNRGWLPVGADRAVLPRISTPAGLLEVTGIAALPPSKIYELAAADDSSGEWQVVWQNLDFKRYQAATGLTLQPVVIQMDKGGPGGFAYDWSRPNFRIATNLGYAFQWYGMAAILALIYIVVNIKKKPEPETEK